MDFTVFFFFDITGSGFARDDKYEKNCSEMKRLHMRPKRMWKDYNKMDLD
jgi:hypothetical protein